MYINAMVHFKCSRIQGYNAQQPEAIKYNIKFIKSAAEE